MTPDVARILVVDDEPDLLTLYELSLLREGHQVATAATVLEARRLLEAQGFDLLITDMRLPDGDGLQLLRELAQQRRSERSIMITAYGSAETAVEALKCGAFDYLTKPVDLKQLRSVVRAALQAVPGTTAAASAAISHASPPVASVSLPPLVPTPTVQAVAPQEDSPGQAALARLVGDSALMVQVKQRITKVARSMAPVLVHGESGTGKELVAYAVHACSHRHQGPFVPVNCGAIPENLLEAEFFGALKGSYTGATQDREGFFQAAAGGTLFLDEIGDLPLAMQAKLLRAIQERSVRPLGATQEQPVDVRIVSATHKRLAHEVEAGRFRQDLYYRLNVIEIIIPPLRQRREDIPAISRVLLGRIAAETGDPQLQPTPEQLAEITQAPLPGNVRELENLLHRMVALGSSQEAVVPSFEAVVSPAALDRPPDPLAWPEAGAPVPQPAQASLSLLGWLDVQEQALLQQVLTETEASLPEAAARLGLSERQLRCRLQRLGLGV